MSNNYQKLTKTQGCIEYHLNIVSSRLDEKYPERLWLKFETAVLCQMETTHWEQQTKVLTLL